MNWEELLAKYMRWVRECEGVDFIRSGLGLDSPSENFSKEEFEELTRISIDLDAEDFE